MRRVLILATCLVAAILAATALAAATGAHGKVCGKTKCLVLPRSLATHLSQREGTYTSPRAPKPAPYYRIAIKASGDGYINRTIIWVPSRRLWFLKEYVTPPGPGYWRTDDPRVRAPLLRLVRRVKPHPAPTSWKAVLPR